MNWVLLRSHLLALAGGIVFGGYCSAASGIAPPEYVVIFFMSPLAGLVVLVILAATTLLGIGVVRTLARFLGAHDSFVFLAGVVALALTFSLEFYNSVMVWLTSRGELHGTILGGGPAPEDVGGHVLAFVARAIWITLMTSCGLAYKRREEKTGASSPRDTTAILTWTLIDSALIALATTLLLASLLSERRAWSSPQAVYQRETNVLQNPGATAGDRALAMSAIEHNPGPQTTEMLERAMKEETGENQLHAAAALLGRENGREDVAALAVLDDALMGRTSVTGTLQPTSSVTPTEGNGVRTMGFAHLGRQKYGFSVRNVKSPDAVPALVHLMTSPSSDTRQGASYALRVAFTLKMRSGGRSDPTWPATLNTAPATQAMIAALDDPDEMVRYFAVCTLMELNGNPHYPAIFLFKDNEKAYIDGWKAYRAGQ
jgi:hypothetical protein